MSEHHNTEDYTENKEKSETIIVSPDESESETNEHFEFEEETLQITDVHAFEHTVGEFPVHGAAELSSSSRLWTSNESPASDIRFLDQTPGIYTVDHGALDLQSEFADLGLNTLYPSAKQDVDSSFEVSFEKNTPSKNDTNIKVTGVNNDVVNSSANVIEPNLDIIEDIRCEDSKVSFNKLDDIPFDRNQALFNDLSSTAENVYPFNVNILENSNVANNSEEINRPNNPCMTAIMPDSNQTENNIQIHDNCRTIDNGADCMQPSQSTYDDKSSEDSKLIADISNSVENKPDGSDLLSEETDGVFVDEIDSFVSNKEVLYPEENELIYSSNSHIVKKHNSIQPEKIKETNKMETLEKVEETYQVELLSGTDEIVEKIYAMGESMCENVDLKKTYEVQQTTSRDIVKETHAIEESLFKGEVVKEFCIEDVVVENNVKETCNIQICRSVEVVTEKYAMKESVSESDVFKVTCSEKTVKEMDEMKEFVPENDVIRETYQVQNSSSEEVKEGTLSMEKAKLKNDVFKKTQETSLENVVDKVYDKEECTFLDDVGEISSKEIAEKIHAMEEYMSENDVDKKTYQVQQTTSGDIIEERHAPVDFMLEVDVGKETLQAHQSSAEEFVEETQVVELFVYENDVRKPHKQLSSSTEIVTDIRQMTDSMSMSESNVDQETSFEEIIKEIHALEESVSEKVATEISAMKEFVSENNVFKEAYEEQQSSSEEVKEETHSMKESNLRNDVFKQTQPSSTEIVVKIKKYNKEESTFEKNVVEEISSKEIVDGIYAKEEYESENDVKETYQVQQTTSEDIVEETHATVDFMPEVDDQKKTHHVQQSSPEEVIEETQVMEFSVYENDVRKPPEVHLSSSTEIVTDIHSTAESMSMSENNVDEETSFEVLIQEIHASEQSSLENVMEETRKMEEPILENGVIKQTSFNENEDESYAIKETAIEINVAKDTYAMFMSKDDVEETHQVQQSSSEEVVEEADVVELPMYENDFRKPHYIQQSSFKEVVKEICALKDCMSEDNVANETISEDVVKEIYAIEESLFVDNVVNEISYVVLVEKMHEIKEQISESNFVNKTNQVKQTTSKGIVEETLATVDFMPEIDVEKETHKVQQSSSEEVVEETHVVDLSIYENGDRNPHHIDLSSSTELVPDMHSMTESLSISEEIVAKETSFEEVIKELHALEESVFEKNVIVEAHKEQQSSLENVTEETHPVEEPFLENEVTKETHQVQQTSFKGVEEETYAMEDITFEYNVAKDTCTEEVVKDIPAMKECITKKDDANETNGTVECVPKDNDREIHHMHQSNSAEPTEKKHAMVKSISKDDVNKSRSDEIEGVMRVMEENKLKCDDSKETHKMRKSSPQEAGRTSGKGKSLFEDNFVTETHQMQQPSCEEVTEETLAVERSVNNVVKETHLMQQSSSDDIIKETQGKKDSMFERIFVGETRPVQDSGSEDVVEKKLTVGESLSENNFNDESCQVQLFSLEEVGEGTHKINEKVLDKLPMLEEDRTDQSGFKETAFKTVNQKNSPKENVSDSKSSVTEELAKIQTDFGSESSFYCQRTLDMSLTIVGMTSDNQDTSESSSGNQEGRCKSPANQVSQTLSDFLDNADIEDTNDFTAHSDQKMYDALYIPLSGCNDSTYSVNENGLQSFMEITMANTNLAMIEQNLGNTTKQAEPHQGQRTNKSSEDSRCNESPYSSMECEELISCSTNSNILYDSDSINNKNHELLQQSMSDYVTNLSLKLAIPDSCYFSNVNYADDETRQNCEKQTESALLMKWPAQYHNNITILKQQNHSLLESSNQKDTVINKLKLDNKDLLQKLSEVVARSQDLNQENCTLKNELDKGEHQIITLQQENRKLFKDLEALQSIESELFDFKIKNEDLIHAIEKNRLAKQSEIQVLKNRIEELEHDLLNIHQNVTDAQRDSLEVSILVESIQSKDNQIETLLKDNSLLKEKVTCLSTHLKTVDELKQENDKLQDVLQLEKEKSKDMDKLKIMVKKQNDDICDQYEKLSKLSMDLNEKEEQIQELFRDKISLEEAVVLLNNQLTELRKIEDENRQLKSDLQGEKAKREEMVLVSKSLEEHKCIQDENISKLNRKICEKDCQIEALANSNADLKDVLETLNQRFEELKESEKENEKLKISIKQSDEQVKEIISLKISLEEQVSNLKAQNELLWNSLKVSSTKEQNLSALKEERLLLEEKISQMKREIQEINNLKSDNKHLFDELTNKVDEIRNLTADKKKLKSSLIKASDKLNERDAEIERLSEQLQLLDDRLNVLNEENTELQNRLDETTKEETLRAELNNEMLTENIGNVSEYLTSLIFENAYLAKEIIVCDTEDKKLTGELMSLRKKIVEEKALFDSLLLEKESLLSIVGSLKKTVTLLTEELNRYKYQCNEITLFKEENEILTAKINNLSESVMVYEDEKTCMFRDMSSLSETISSLLIDRQLLSEQLEISSEISQRLDLLTAEKYQLEQQIVQHEQNNVVLHQSISTLQNQLETVKDQDKIIDELKDFSSGLENHLSSMNEELMSEMSKNQFLCVTVNELESKLIQNNEERLMLQNSMSSLTDQLNISREKHSSLRKLVADLEDHISSLNEELMSEIAKNHFLVLGNDNLECQKTEIIGEKLFLENMVSHAIESIKNRLQNTDIVSNRQVSLQTYIDTILLEISNFEDENFKLKCDINNFQATLQNSNQSLADLLKAKENLEIELSKTVEQKLELENRLTVALAKESDIQTLEKENEMLLKVAEVHKCCEDAKRLLQNEKSNLEVKIQTLTEAIDVSRREQHHLDAQLEENVQLKQVMAKEIHSLTGEIWDLKLEPLTEVYQRLMKEFLNKEKEVILSLQSDFECKIKFTQEKLVSLKNELNEKDVLTSKLVNEVEEFKMHLNHRDTLISSLEKDLFTIKNESNGAYEIEEMRLQAEKEKEILTTELKSVQHVNTKLQEKISILNNEVTGKNNEILQLKTDLEKVQCEKTNLLRCIEEDCGVSKHQKDLLDELTSKLNDKQELISQLDLQLQNKNNEVSQLTKYLENKEIETRQYLTKIEEITPAVLKLNAIENEFDLIRNVTSLDEEFNIESFVGSLQACKVFGDITKLIVSKFVETLKQLQLSNDNLKHELSNQMEVCKSLETQINDMNEELKSCKLLYDEDSLQFKEEIAAKNVALANLTEALEELKQNACLDADLNNKCTEMERMKEELNKLKEENAKLQNESNRITYLTGVNRKLSWEIEELSRSIKFEKQSNVDLKAKCELAASQVADLSKKNFQLEDKIGGLERKLENHDVMSSLKIGFPLGINTLDKQVQYVNEKLAEFNQINSKLNKLNDEHNSLKHEYEKSKEYIQKQEEKLCKIMKRELELKKQMASNLQTSPDIKILKELKAELLSLFPGESLSLSEVLLKIKSLLEEEKEVLVLDDTEIKDLKQKIKELSQDNKDLDVECEMMNKQIKGQEELLAAVFKREEELKKLNAELKSHLPNHLQTNIEPPAVDNNLKELFEIFPEKPVSLKDSINLVKLIMHENQALKEKISESQEEYASLDKECEDMFTAYKEKEKELADVIRREASSVSDLKNKQQELETELKSLSEELQVARSQLIVQENRKSVSTPCQCEELKSRLSELKVDLAERNAKITALEMQFEADNFPLKKKVADLEKSLDQAKQKVNELKSEVRKYREQMCDVTVGLQAECERCRSLGTAADPMALTTLQQQLQEKIKEIQILKALCRSRNQRIKELEDRDGSYKMPRSQRTALKEVKENQTVAPSSTKPSKGGLQ